MFELIAFWAQSGEFMDGEDKAVTFQILLLPTTTIATIVSSSNPYMEPGVRECKREGSGIMRT